ncbi:MAG: hypothetical protein IPK78_12375 [Rhodospirillales bacterium]|nr:hypothetical protein [Rhodospirillales bacterium]
MRRPLVYSAVLHTVVIALVAFGLPALAPPPLVIEEPMVVELVPLAEVANPPPAKQPAPVPELAKPVAPPAREEKSEPTPAGGAKGGGATGAGADAAKTHATKIRTQARSRRSLSRRPKPSPRNPSQNLSR